MKRFAYSSLILILARVITAVVFLFPAVVYSQNPEWMNFTSGANVRALADDGDYLWVGGVGLTRLNKATGEMVFYNKANSGLPYNDILALAIDTQGNIWVGTDGGGLAKFDGVNWTVYSRANSGLPNNQIFALAIDLQGDIWIGTWGLAKFDGANWTVYNTGNSGLPSNHINALAIDTQGNIWVGTNGGGLAKFDGTNWIVLTGGHFEMIKGIDNIGLLPIFCQQTMDKGRRLPCCPSPRLMILSRAIFVESFLVCQG